MSARAQILRAGLSLLAVACAVVLHAAARAAAQTASPQVSPAQVAQTVERVRSASPDDETTAQAVALGHTLLREGRYREAGELFGALVERRPREASALYGAALAALNQGRSAEAEPLARAAVEIRLAALEGSSARGASAPKLSAADALVLHGVILAVRGDDAAALKKVKQAATVAPEHFDAQFALGRALYGAGNLAEAANAFRAAVALNPADARARFFLATTLERAGDAAAALAAYRELVAHQPRSAEGHLGLGALLVKGGDAAATEGVEALGRAVSINPDLYEARVTLGRALVARGRADEAVEHLRRAAELAPGNPEPHYQLALAYRRLGRRTEAAAETAIVKQIHEARRKGRSRPNETPATPDKL